ncbi:MAG TPA: retroviral-like aspartic protease family protein [Caulobacteraceae bacterium]|nr:retroviral-like aspartic protease family protein [Caulobacteraceae bacterium]
MVARTQDRRGLIAGMAALGLAAPELARAAVGTIVEIGGNASRLTEIPSPQTTPQGPAYLPPAKISTVLDIYKRMTAPVSVAGAGPFAFVADTGANQSVIAAELAQQLGLAIGDTQALNGVAGVQMTPTATARIQIGSRAEREATLSVLPGAAIGGPGLLGLDLLDGGQVTLDFGRQTLTIDGGPAMSGSGDEVELKAHRRDGQLTLVDADLAGIRLTAFIDSGAQDTIGNMALRQLAVTRYPLIPWRPIPIVSVTGQTIDAVFADLPGLRIGGLSVPTWPVAFADLHTFKLWNLVDRPAILIGVDVLSRFESVCLDFRRDEVRLRLPQRV